jgi:hypothetical protein
MVRVWRRTSVMSPEDLRVQAAMSMYGGSFVQALAEAFVCADLENRRRIKATWPEYWEQYTNLAERHAEREKSKGSRPGNREGTP